MVIFDRRDAFEDTDSELTDVAAECHKLYESDRFQEDVADALTGVVRQYLDVEAVDAEAERVIREFMAQEATGACFQYRNQIVTNADVDLQRGDLIEMVSARDPEETIRYVVHSADPDDTGVRVYRVPKSDDEDPRMMDHGAGHVMHDGRFTVDRSTRDLDLRPFEIARRLWCGDLKLPNEPAGETVRGP